jgi:hypothetical protein
MKLLDKEQKQNEKHIKGILNYSNADTIIELNFGKNEVNMEKFVKFIKVLNTRRFKFYDSYTNMFYMINKNKKNDTILTCCFGELTGIDNWNLWKSLTKRFNLGVDDVTIVDIKARHIRSLAKKFHSHLGADLLRIYEKEKS